MLLGLLLLFTVVPFFEFYLLLKFGQAFGVLDTLAVIIITGFLGAYLARSQGRILIQSAQEQMQKGQLPADSLLQGVLVFLGGLLLIAPGFITDFFGLLLVLPFTRPLFVSAMRRYLVTKLRSGHLRVQFGRVEANGQPWTGPEPYEWRDVSPSDQLSQGKPAEIIDLNTARRDRKN